MSSEKGCRATESSPSKSALGLILDDNSSPSLQEDVSPRLRDANLPEISVLELTAKSDSNDLVSFTKGPYHLRTRNRPAVVEAPPRSRKKGNTTKAAPAKEPNLKRGNAAPKDITKVQTPKEVGRSNVSKARSTTKSNKDSLPGSEITKAIPTTESTSVSQSKQKIDNRSKGPLADGQVVVVANTSESNAGSSIPVSNEQTPGNAIRLPAAHENEPNLQVNIALTGP
ncbi:hypothetical protein FRC03_011691, partial [Tulasnella sp. 419]